MGAEVVAGVYPSLQAALAAGDNKYTGAPMPKGARQVTHSPTVFVCVCVYVCLTE